ncbi:MAG: hypothetical protein M3P49_16855 [Actinomycetota bacterium]|nr:hypothetical protein [Actinomycetota bacterium]
MEVRFEPGVVVATPGALELIGEFPETVAQAIQRHLSGDWGEVDAHDRKANDDALKYGTRLLSAYTLPSGVKVWIITEADRSSTTFLLPEEY